jgi:beta-RFAP synthase
MVGVRAHSRLHFGLLNPGGWVSSRRFGGVGLMVERPGLRLGVEASASWSAEGPLAERALAFAHRCAQSLRQERGDIDLSPRRLAIEWAAPEHVGLGTGTQLGLAVARALAVSWGVEADVPTLARWVGRGLRSALGTHGFEQGGFLVEAGKHSADGLAPLVARLPFPDDWRVVLVLPRLEARAAGWHGLREVQAFAQLADRPAPPERMDVLCRLVLLGLLPALAERDVEAFGEALYEFNVRVGEAFAPVQGGVYASADVAEVVAFVRGQGIRGVGQSSWGPTVFAVVADADQAEHLSARLRARFGLEDAAVPVTPACNHGAT